MNCCSQKGHIIRVVKDVFVIKDKVPMLQQRINTPIKINKLAVSLDSQPSMLYRVYLDCYVKSQ
ncbi:hypothetical protein SAMN04488089_10289 [Myroides profundi]|uniref:Uncharacterized protein n=1 Tax=Myroides profundi TaxID=480520 RepID=A0AAJ5BCT7_MYRPR|nr:hypothetical protein SAMN04488089_10289 [Myroides profundi]